MTGTALVRTGLSAAAVVTGLAMLTGTASAAGTDGPASPANVGASACFSTAPPSAVVYQVSSNVRPNLTLSCGDYTHGVIHIDSDHPIAENGSDNANIDKCMLNILSYGYDVSASTGNEALQIRRNSNGGTATIVWRTSDYQIVTMYTSDSNNWAACANYLPGDGS